MSLKDLEGKRIGRPAGSRNAPPWLRAARWVLGHLDEPGAEAPTPLARLLAEQARQDLVKFLLALDSMERAQRGQQAGNGVVHADQVGNSQLGRSVGQVDGRNDTPKGDAPPSSVSAPQQAPPKSPPVQSPPARRVKRLIVSGKDLVQWLLGQREPPWLRFLPGCFDLVGCTLNKSGDANLLVKSWTFEPVAEGEEVPTINWGTKPQRTL